MKISNAAKEKLYNLYILQELGSPDIAKMYNTYPGKIRQMLRKMEIPIRTRSEARSTNICIQKARETCIKNYGTTHPLRSKIIQEKKKKTNLKKYGVEHVAQNIAIKKKTQDTCIKKYGVSHPMHLPHIRKKCENICLRNHGCKYPSQKHLSKTTISNLNNAKWLKQQHHDKKKTYTQIASELGVSISTITNSMRKYQIQTQSFRHSLIEQQWLDSLNLKNLERNKRIYLDDGNYYKPDGYDSDTNTIYEFLGDYWHGNPKIYDPTDIWPQDRKTLYGELYKTIMCKIQILETAGYNVEYIWENDFNKNKNKENKC